MIRSLDDLIITGERPIAACKKDLASEYEITYIGLMHYFLGLDIWQEPGHIFLGQGKYTVDILRRFRMEDSKLMSTPMVTNWKKLHACGGVGGSYIIMSAHWFLDVSGQLSARFVFCGEHS